MDTSPARKLRRIIAAFVLVLLLLALGAGVVLKHAVSGTWPWWPPVALSALIIVFSAATVARPLSGDPRR